MNTKTQKIDFKALKERITMSEILLWYGLFDHFKDDGKGGYKGPCPFKNNDQTGTSFRIAPEGRAWFNHDKDLRLMPSHPITKEKVRGGNVLDFVMIKDGLGLAQAGRKIVELEIASKTSSAASAAKEESAAVEITQAETPDSKRVIPERHLTFTEKGYKLLNLEPEHDQVLALGLELETAEAFGLGYSKTGIMKGRVAFPIRNISGEVVAYGGLKQTEDSSSDWIYPNDFYPELEVSGLQHFSYRQKQVGEPQINLVIISFDLLEQARCAFGLGGDSNLSVAILSERLSLQQIRLLTDFQHQSVNTGDDEFGYEGQYLIRVKKPEGKSLYPQVVKDLLSFLPNLNFTKIVQYE
jgi:hypothetical protein